MRIGVAGPFLTRPFYPELGIKKHTSIPEGLGGTPIVSLVQGFLSTGNEVTVFTLDPDVHSEVVLEGERLTICIGPYRRTHRARDFFRVERDYLCAAMQREKPDVIHAHWTYEFALAALVSGIPALITAHDAPLRILRLTPDAYRAVRAVMAWSVARRAGQMTAVSRHIERHFRQALRYRGQMTVVTNAIADYIFQLGRTRKVPDSNRIVFATVLTGWSRVKNGDTALQAFARVRRELPGAELRMFGPGYGIGEQAECWAKARGLDAGVHFIGSVPQERLGEQLASDVDMLIHSSREEAFSMAVAEAMAIGLAVIGGQDSGGVPEVLDYGASGLLVDIESPRELAAAMIGLGNDVDKRIELGQRARASAERKFAPAAVAGVYHSILENLR